MALWDTDSVLLYKQNVCKVFNVMSGKKVGCYLWLLQHHHVDQCLCCFEETPYIGICSVL